MTYGPFQNPFPSYPGGGGGDGGGLFVLLGFLPGFLFGVYDNLKYNHSPIESAGGAAGLAFALCTIGGEKIENINPNSGFLGFVGGTVHWLGGIGFGIYAGIGGLTGSLIPWAIKDVTGANQRRSELEQPFQLASKINSPLNLLVSFQDQSSHMRDKIKYAAIIVTLHPVDSTTVSEISRPNRSTRIGEPVQAII